MLTGDDMITKIKRCRVCKSNRRVSLFLLHFLLSSLVRRPLLETCGFLLPAFHQFLKEQEAAKGYTGKPVSSNKPKLLVLAPTRELSVQIMEEAAKFGRLLGIRSLCCYGGSPKYPQIAALQKGVECVIATPGRLNDLIEMRRADLSGIQFLVLDEVRRNNKIRLSRRAVVFC